MQQNLVTPRDREAGSRQDLLSGGVSTMAPELHGMNPEDDDEADEYYDDGQPDEAQEWHDYDPDC